MLVDRPVHLHRLLFSLVAEKQFCLVVQVGPVLLSTVVSISGVIIDLNSIIALLSSTQHGSTGIGNNLSEVISLAGS